MFPFISNLSLGFILTYFSIHLLHLLEIPQSFITENRSAQMILWNFLVHVVHFSPCAVCVQFRRSEVVTGEQKKKKIRIGVE